MSDKSIDKLNEQIKELSSDRYASDDSFDNVHLKVIKEKPSDIERTVELDKIENIEENNTVKEKKEEITRKIELGDTKEISKKEIDSLTKKIEKMKDTDEYTFDTTTGIFSNEVDEPLIKKAVLLGIGIFTVLILLLIIVIIL